MEEGFEDFESALANIGSQQSHSCLRGMCVRAQEWIRRQSYAANLSRRTLSVVEIPSPLQFTVDRTDSM